MGIFSRLSDIVNSNISAMLEKAEDPEKIVRLMIQEMEDTLVEVRSAAARAIADKKELTRRLGAFKKEEAEWERKAELAISKGRDDLAKAALVEKAGASNAAESLDVQLGQIEDGLADLNDDIARLQEKLADAKNRQKGLLVRHRTASKRLAVRKQLHENHIDDALVRFEQFEKKMEQIEGRIEAYDLGQMDNLRREFVSLETEESVEQELAELKQKLAARSE